MVLLLHAFFKITLPIVFFLYGLAFFSLGLAILLETPRASRLRIAAILPLFAAFGLIHGIHEWLVMVGVIEGGVGTTLGFFIITAQVISAILLVLFGTELIGRLGKQKWVRFALLPLLLIWILLAVLFFSSSLSTFFHNGEILTLYFFFLPGSVLAAIGLISQHRELTEEKLNGVARNYLVVAILLIINGFIEGFFTIPKSFFFPASFINEQAFLDIFHFPAQLLRGILAIMIAVFFIRGLRVFEEESERRVTFLEEKRRILDILQMSLLKRKKPVIRGLQIATHYESATLEAAIGGDFFDFVDLGNDKWAFGVGDVSGKGIEAASDAFLTSQAMRCLVFEYKQPKDIMERINSVIWRQTPSGFFVTMALFVYDQKNAGLVYSDGGHPYPILCSLANCRFLTKSGTALGVNSHEVYNQEAISFQEGDFLVLYTDGLVEAKSNREFFGDDRLIRLVASNKDLSAQGLINLIMDKVTAFSRGVLRDDIVLVVIKKMARD